jgi:putative glutamine amidotransferase
VRRAAAPRIVITVTDTSRAADPALARRKNELYATAVARHGGEPVLVEVSTAAAVREAAFASMDGLLLSGGADIHPSRYGAPVSGARDPVPERDELESRAWSLATERGSPVLGICRGFQAINVFSGGSLIQDVAGHAGPSWGTGRATTHPLRVEPGTRLARILFPTNVRGGVLEVNSYHHQAVGPKELAPDLVPNARAASPAGDLIEGFETRDGRFVLGVQCHPERTDSTSPAFDRLFAFFVDAARGPMRAR